MSDAVMEKGDFLRELEEGRRVQLGMLPQSVPQPDGLQVAAHCSPALKVGGDFYDFVPLSEKRLGLLVGDAVGHGIASALLMATTLTSFRFLAILNLEGSDVLRQLNRQLHLLRHLSSSTSVAAAYCILDPVRGSVSVTQAGVQPMMARRGDGRCAPLETAGYRFPLGSEATGDYRASDVVMQDGDVLVLTTDGIPEARNRAGELYGFRRLQDIVAQNADGNAMQVMDAVLLDVQAFVARAAQEDDITIVVVKADRHKADRIARKPEPVLANELLAKSIFQYILSPSLVEKLIGNPSMLNLEGEEREMTVLFTDIRDFTGMAASLNPAELVRYMNEYLSEMTEIIIANDGMFDKYVGDEIMALWGVPVPFPDHAKKACFAALEMSARLASMRAEWGRTGKPAIHMGIGINTGNAWIGNMGSAYKMSYTPYGDQINLGARLEGTNKSYRTEILISEFTYAQAKDDIVARELDSIRVKGRIAPVKIYNLIAKKTDSLPSGTRSALELYGQGMAAYRTRDFRRALRLFSGAMEEGFQDDFPTLMQVKRCAYYIGSPPPVDWDETYKEIP